MARVLASRRPSGWRAERQARIRQVIAAGDVLTTVLQPIVDLGSGDRVGAEALARFGGREHRSPDLIFGEALAVGLGVELELAALETGLAAMHHLPSASYLSLNVSPSTVLSPRLAQVFDGADAGRVVLELTEHAEVADYDVLTRALETLRRRGVRLAVDDAGAGFASLRHIVRLSPDFIKLDVSLTRGIDIDPVRQSLAAALVSFARDTGPVVVAGMAVVLDGHRRGQRDSQAGCGEDHASLSLGQGVRVHAVVKPRRDPCPDRHGPPRAQHPPDQPAPSWLGCAADRHEVLDLTHPVLGEETGDQHVGIGEIELTGLRRRRGGQLKAPALVCVQERAEHAGGVERRAAMPVDGAVGSHQGHAVQVTDQSMVSDIRVTCHRFLLGLAKSHPPSRRWPGRYITRHG